LAEVDVANGERHTARIRNHAVGGTVSCLNNSTILKST
jgi:hypothetical protein